MNELALFAGAGGGILGGKLLGWRTVCAVECDAYAASVLAQRQNDRCLEPFPIWSDVRSFDGRPWRGIVDVVSGGFPCQDVAAGSSTKTGLDGERSGLWAEMRRVVREVGPRYVFVENSAMLTARGLRRVLSDLAALGFNGRWGVLGAVDAGLDHERERLWVVAYSNALVGSQGTGLKQQRRQFADEQRVHRDRARDRRHLWLEMASKFHRMDDGMANKVERTECLGNGQVPAVVRLAWHVLSTPRRSERAEI